MSEVTDLETAFFQTVNAFVEPLAEAGWGSPGIVPTGLIVLETTGRRTGRPRRTPVFATVAGSYLVAGTLRGARSDWIKNARANPSVRYWLCGRVHDARALVFAPDEWPSETQDLPPLMRWLAANLYVAAALSGAAFAVLVPAGAGPQP